MNLLIVEDDMEINELLRSFLEGEGYSITSAYDGKTALELFQKDHFDLVLLDLMIPKINGISVMKRIRNNSVVPIIIISARDSDSDKTIGLGFGADDYITKPFQPLELIARVKAQLRRYKKYNNQDNTINTNEIDFRGIRINNSTHEFFFNEKLVELTKTEFAILWKLCANRGNVVKSDELFSKVWGEKYFERDNNTIMVHIRHLREKMNDGGRNPKYIKTVYGMGYKIEK